MHINVLKVYVSKNYDKLMLNNICLMLWFCLTGEYYESSLFDWHIIIIFKIYDRLYFFENVIWFFLWTDYMKPWFQTKPKLSFNGLVWIGFMILMVWFGLVPILVALVLVSSQIDPNRIMLTPKNSSEIMSTVSRLQRAFIQMWWPTQGFQISVIFISIQKFAVKKLQSHCWVC